MLQKLCLAACMCCHLPQFALAYVEIPNRGVTTLTIAACRCGSLKARCCRKVVCFGYSIAYICFNGKIASCFIRNNKETHSPASRHPPRRARLAKPLSSCATIFSHSRRLNHINVACNIQNMLFSCCRSSVLRHIRVATFHIFASA